MRPVTRRAALRRGLAGVVALAAVPAVAAPVRALRVGDLVTDPREVQALRIYRELTPVQRVAWVRMAERVIAGMPMREAGYLAFRECGWSAQDALARVNEVRPRLPGGAP